MPPRNEATAKELAMIGDFFRDDGTVWRVDDVYFDEKAVCPLTGYQRGARASAAVSQWYPACFV